MAVVYRTFSVNAFHSAPNHAFQPTAKRGGKARR